MERRAVLLTLLGAQTQCRTRSCPIQDQVLPNKCRDLEDGARWIDQLSANIAGRMVETGELCRHYYHTTATRDVARPGQRTPFLLRRGLKADWYSM